MGINMQIHNTLSDEKESFVPLKPNHVGMYHCGPTVYGYAHIGNLRSYIFADILRRTFEAQKYSVTQIINITDVGHLTSDADVGDDKIEKVAKEKGEKIADIVEHFTTAFKSNLEALNINTVGTLFPKATEHIPEQISLIRELEKKGCIYITSDGVYFDTSKFPSYGKLGNIDISHLKEGARIGINKEKKNSTDFALWKFSLPHEQRMQEWESPWGKGFPGWHIECSAMSMKYLGETFDIHTGGIDHIPVHHNNEIAQSESATGKKYVNYWMHNAFIRINNEKISKSIGNVILISDIIEKSITPLALRYWFLGGRYSTQMDFTWQSLEDAQRALLHVHGWFAAIINISPIETELSKKYTTKFISLISDDLDTPAGLAFLHELMKDKSLSDAEKHFVFLQINSVLGIVGKIPIVKNKEIDISTISKDIKNLIQQRMDARNNKNWNESDRIRDELLCLGINSKDTAEKSTYFAS